jgi:hypothetical protein
MTRPTGQASARSRSRCCVQRESASASSCSSSGRGQRSRSLAASDSASRGVRMGDGAHPLLLHRVVLVKPACVRGGWSCAARRGGPLTPPGVFGPAETVKRGLPARTVTQVHAFIVAAGPTGADGAHAAAELRGSAEDPPHDSWRIPRAGRPPSHATGPGPGARRAIGPSTGSCRQRALALSWSFCEARSALMRCVALSREASDADSAAAPSCLRAAASRSFW